MRTMQIKGIIILKRDFGEQDRLFHIFTETDGKIEVVAKNVRNGSKRNGHLELFNYGTFFLYKSPNNFYLNQAQTIDEFPKLKANLDTINSAYFATEILDKLTEVHSPSPPIFKGTLTLLKTLGLQPHKRKTLLLAYKIKLLHELGLIPVEIACHSCGNKLAPETEYIAEEHNFYCKTCTEKKGVTISPNAIKLFYYLSAKPLQDCTLIKTDANGEEAIRQLTTLIDLYLEDNLRRPLKSYSLLTS